MQLNVVSQIKKYGAVQAVLNADGSYSLKLPDGSILYNVSSVYTLPGITITGVSNIPAANTVDNGSVVRLHKDVLAGAGSNPLGVSIINDAVNNIWQPVGDRARMFKKSFGSIAAPTLSLSAAAKFNVGVDPVIPAGLLYAGSKFHILAKFQRHGTHASLNPVVRAYLGTDANYINNTIVYQRAMANTDLQSQFASTEIDILTATTATATYDVIRSGAGSAGTFKDVTANFNVGSNMYLTFGVSSIDATNSVDLLSFECWWEA